MFRAVIKLSSGGLVGKLAGFLREVIIATLYGVGTVAVAYRIAISAILIPLNLLTADMLSAGFLPNYQRYRRIAPKLAGQYFWLVAGVCLLVSVLLTALFWVLTKPWVALLAGGLSIKAQVVAEHFTRVMALSLPFFIIGSLNAYLGMGHELYVLQASRSSYQNFGVIVGSMFAYFLKNILWLPIGFLVGQVLFAIVGVWVLHRQRIYPSFILSSSRLGVLALRLWATIRILIFLPFFVQGQIFLERRICSYLSDGSVAALDYARNLTDTLMILMAVPVGLVALSRFAGLPETEANLLRCRVMRWVWFLTIPFGVYMFFRSDVIVWLIYGHGKFTGQAAHITSQALETIALALPVMFASSVLTKMGFARRDNMFTSSVMILALIVNILLMMLGWRFLGISIFGLALMAQNALVVLLMSWRLKLLTISPNSVLVIVSFIPALIYLVMIPSKSVSVRGELPFLVGYILLAFGSLVVHPDIRNDFLKLLYNRENHRY
jgi:putative peptidoglycan lipid II flippase